MNTNMTISLKTLEEKNITPNELVYLYHLFHNQECNYNVDYIKLQELKFIKITADKIYPRYYNLQTLFKDAPESKTKSIDIEDAWSQLTAIYPKKRGNRYIQDKGAALPKLKKALKHTSLDIILKGADNENKARSAATGEFFPEPKNLSAWLNQESWLTYLDYEEEDDINDKVEFI